MSQPKPLLGRALDINGTVAAMSLGDRIREAIDASGEKDFVIADAARISTTTLSNIVRGVTQDPSISVVAAIADALGESVDALLQRPGHPLLKHERQTLTNAAHILLERVVPAPSEQKVTAHRVAPRSRKRVESVVLSDVAASPNRQIFTDVHEIRRFPIPRDLRARGVRRVFRVDGDSMTGAGIQHGDILFVRTNVTLEQANNQIVVCRHGDDEMVKRLRVNADRTVTLQSANDKYKPQTLTAEQARDLQVYGIVHSRITAVPSAG